MKIHNHRSRREERGVALLLALGSLSLMLVTGMAFLSNAIVARQTAENYRGRAQAKTIARSAMARLMLRLKYDLNNAASPWDERLDKIVSRAITGDDSPAQDSDALTDRIDDDERFMRSYVNGERKTVEELYGSGKRPQWEYLYDLYDSSGKVKDDAKIIGRIAYMAIPGTANVNLSEVLRGHPDAVAASHSETGWEKRRGVGIRELNFGIGLFEGSRNALETLAQRFTSGEDYSSDQSRDYSARDYQSFDEFYTVLGKNSVKRFRRWMLPSGYNEPEVYAHDGSAGSGSTDYTDSADFYHRFWLNRKQADWNALTVDDLLKPPSVGFDKGVIEQPKSNTIKELPYLCKLWWENDKSGEEYNYKSVEARRRQVAANLIDYADEDSIPTSDSTNWWTQAPTYTGLEKTHYLNEVAVQFVTTVVCEHDHDDTDINGVITKRWYRLNTSVYAGQILLETVNIYEENFPNQQISIEGEIGYRLTLANGNTQEGKVNFSQLNKLYAPNRRGRYGYIIFEPEEPGYTDLGSISIGVAPTVNQAEMKMTITSTKIKRMYLMDASGKPVDYAGETGCDWSATVHAFQVPLGDVTIDRCTYTGAAVDDPRENLTTFSNHGGSGGDQTCENWIQTLSSKIFDDIATNDLSAINESLEGLAGAMCLSIGAVNPFFQYCKGKYGDQLTYEKNINDDLDNISTAYIRNKVMETPLELGAIHRAGKWETINLKKAAEKSSVYQYDPTTAAADLTAEGGFTYADGDAAILDQIKMTERVFSPGKINMNFYPDNTAENYLFQAAFEGIPWEILSLENYAAATQLSEDAASAIRDQLGGNHSAHFLSRGAMIGYPYSDSGTANRMANAFGQIAPANDLQAEAIPAMAAALFTANSTEPDTISFVLVAQAINDLGGGFTVGKVRLDDPDQTVEHKVEYGKFDLEKVGDRFYYFDEILGEVKMLITIRCERETRKVTLIQAEYID